jgi:glycosyltransferase involved in cell wall biosynthesis
LFYTKTGNWFRQLSDATVRNSDVFNVPNEEEKQFLVSQGTPEHRVTVQPYGLSPDRRISLRRTALPSSRRLEKPKVSFIGMWSPRKGARDWEAILKLVWREVPETRFAFLGTMTDSEVVLRDLGLRFSERIEIVPDYAQTELPELLADSTVGAFPSYVEGFGIAVLEQLGAGIPTVAFDVAGPRDMLKFAAPVLLVPAGDIAAFAAALVRLLQLELPSYETLSDHCKKVAESFDWTVIARDTARVYHGYLTGREPSPGPPV